MKISKFDSNDYRYFYLIDSPDWLNGDSYGWDYAFFKKGDIIKIPKKQLTSLLFGRNYYSLGQDDAIYEHEVIEYPADQPFNILNYIAMQKPIKFKRNGVLRCHYEYGEYLLMNSWMTRKLFSSTVIKYISPIYEDYFHPIGQINTETMREISTKEQISVNLSGSPALLLNSNEKGLLLNEKNKDIAELHNLCGYRFSVHTPFIIEYHAGEVWHINEDFSILLLMFNQDFIRLLACCVEIPNPEKERIFTEEYEGNVANTSRRYYKVKDGITVRNMFQIWNENSTEDFGCSFDPFVIRMCGGDINICSLNENNFNSDGSIRFFYADYNDNMGDRLIEKELLKISTRLTKEEAQIRFDEDMAVIKNYNEKKEAEAYVKSHKSQYKKFSRKNLGTTSPVEFLREEKRSLIKRIVDILSC